MKRTMQSAKALVLIVGLGGFLPACSTFTLQQVDFGWPVESVLTVKDNNTVAEGRYVIAFNVAPLAVREFQDSTALKGKEIRLLRSNEGLYFLTGPNFKYVYVMTPGASVLKLWNAFEVSKIGLKHPVLNQRDPYVELLDGKDMRVLMTSNDIVQQADLQAERH